MEERVHPIPFRTRKLSSPSPMILHNVMWESRPLSTIAPRPLAALSARGLVFLRWPTPHHLRPLPLLPIHPILRLYPSIFQVILSSFLVASWFSVSPGSFSSSLEVFGEPVRLIYQNRLFWPDGVKMLFLMLTYLSTLRLKTGFFLVRPKNAYFANSPNTSHRLRFALASLRKATPRPAFDGGL